MDLDLELVQAIQVVAQGATALSYAAQANGSVPGVSISDDFVSRTMTGPLHALASLLGVEEPPRPRARRQPKRRRSKAAVAPQGARARGLPEPPDLGDFYTRVNTWDPDDRPYSSEPNSQLEASSCRALLLEVIRRASYDWVLYRASTKLQNKFLADSAYQWLFQEDNTGLSWALRQRNGKELMSFISICETLDLEPERVRDKVRQMTERDIMGAGRPAERRRPKVSSEDVMQAEDLRVFDVDVDSLPHYDPMFVSEG